MAFRTLSDETFIEILHEGIVDAEEAKRWFASHNDEQSAVFCNRMIARLSDAARRLQVHAKRIDLSQFEGM